MFAEIFDSPLIDIILVILALRYIFPALFTFKVIRLNQPQQSSRLGRDQNEEGSIHIKSSVKNKSNNDDHQGEYIDYEEVK